MSSKGIIKWIFLSSIIISFGKSISQPLQFSEERIEIKIYDGYAIVNGNYSFKNNSIQMLNRTLFYPFPVSESFPYPDSIYIFNYNEAVSFSKSSTGIYFSITVLTDSVTSVRISYRQKINSDEMKYILTSAQQWKKPLQKAEYIISLPLEFELQSLSLNPYEIESNTTNNIYYINKNNFMPETDLIITWARREK